jgi:acetyl esterase/lipase
MELPAIPFRTVLAVVMLGVGCLARAAAADAPASTLGTPIGFVAPDWLQRERPGLVKALAGVQVYKDIEYVPGASRQPLAHPEQMAPEAVAYIKAGGKTRAFDLFLPAGLQAQMPVVVWFHGSPATGKKEDWCPAYCLLTHGYILVSANYRLSGEAPFPAQINDDKAVIRWLRAHAAEYHIDPDRIGIWGHSAGGLQVDLMGASNDEPSLEGDEGNLNFSSHVQAACVWSGGAQAAWGLDKFIDSKKTAPFIIMHGTQDNMVPIEWDENLAQMLVKAGVECTFVPVPGAGHQMGSPKLEKQVIAFFDRHLKADTARYPEEKDWRD